VRHYAPIVKYSPLVNACANNVLLGSVTVPVKNRVGESTGALTGGI
jgi:hypothetical protein